MDITSLWWTYILLTPKSLRYIPQMCQQMIVHDLLGHPGLYWKSSLDIRIFAHCCGLWGRVSDLWSRGCHNRKQRRKHHSAVEPHRDWGFTPSGGQPLQGETYGQKAFVHCSLSLGRYCAGQMLGRDIPIFSKTVRHTLYLFCHSSPFSPVAVAGRRS